MFIPDTGSGFFSIPEPDPVSRGQPITGSRIQICNTNPMAFMKMKAVPIFFFSVADPDPGSGAFLTPGPGSGIGFFRIPDLGSRIPNSYFCELSDNFLGKKFYNSLKIGPNFFLQHLKTKIMFNFVKFVAT